MRTLALNGRMAGSRTRSAGQAHGVVTAGQAGFRADRALCALVQDLNRRAAKTLFHAHHVRLNGVPATGSERVQVGDRLEFPDPNAPGAENVVEKAKAPRLTTPHGRHLVRLYEDTNILVISKPAEIPVHRGQGGFTRRDTLEDVLERAYDKFYFVHRLDMETSGCLLIAKNEAARDALIRDFSQRKLDKEYLAVVSGAVNWDEMVVRRPIKYVRAAVPADETTGFRPPRWVRKGAAPMPGQKKGVALEDGSAEGKASETHFKVIQRFRGFSLLHVTPKTGRTHQIRVHLLALGHPLAYDPLYGRGRAIRLDEINAHLGDRAAGDEIVLSRLPLHAWKLSFTHPVTGARLAFEAPLPRDLKEFLKLLGKYK
jgi:23S rRNA-/tRNA-specific pseudouridylate synthase